MAQLYKLSVPRLSAICYVTCKHEKLLLNFDRCCCVACPARGWGWSRKRCLHRVSCQKTVFKRCIIVFEYLCSKYTDINCTAVSIEYNNTRCEKVHHLCAGKSPNCAVSEFCSDECRSMYQKVLRCKNNTIEINRIELLCAPSSDPLRYSTCLDVILNKIKNNAPYSYSSKCRIELDLEEESDSCKKKCNISLIPFKNDCCIINSELSKVTWMYNAKANLHNRTLWERCGIESPQICPFLPCPVSPTPTLRVSGAAKHHMNWFIFITFILANIQLASQCMISVQNFNEALQLYSQPRIIIYRHAGVACMQRGAYIQEFAKFLQY